MDVARGRIWLSPKTLSDAIGMLDEHQDDRLKIVAGATDVIPQMRDRRFEPQYLVDLWSLQELKKIKEEESYISIGAMATMTSLASHALVNKHCPALGKAASVLGSPQIRNRATIGGNICNASPAADTLPVLIALNSRVHLKSALTSRDVAVEDLFTGPGKTIINSTELLTTVFVPKSDRLSGFIKLGKRNALTCAVASCAIAGNVKDGKLKDIVAVFGALGPTPLKIKEITAALEGCDVSEESARKGALLARQHVKPIDDLRGSAAYRMDMAGVLFRRLFNEVFLKMPSGGPSL